MYAKFEENRKGLVRYFKEELGKVVRQLNFASYHPTTIKEGGFDYYHSSPDQIATYQKATEFCVNWGGRIFSFTSEKEHRLLKESSHVYWYEKSQILHQNSLYNCTEFIPGQKKLKLGKSC